MSMDASLKKFLEDFDLSYIADDLEAANIIDLETMRDVIHETCVLESVILAPVPRARLLNVKSELAERIGSQDFDESQSTGFSEESQDILLETELEVFRSNPLMRSGTPEVMDLDECLSLEKLQDSFTRQSKTAVRRVNSDVDDLHRSAKRCKQSTLLTFLESSAEGKWVIARYNAKDVENCVRTKLAELIIAREFGADTETIIGSRRFIQLAKEIEETFPDEEQEYFYLPAHTPTKGKTQLAKGKLYDNYTNFCRKLRKCGLRKSIRGDSVNLPGLPPLPSQGSDNLDHKLNFLKSKVGSAMWPTIEVYWQETSAYRLNTLIRGEPKGNVSDYINDYTCLKSSKGFSLLLLDFKKRYPEADLRITSHWGEFSSNVRRELAKKGISTECDMEVLVNFVKLFGVCPVKLPKGKPWRPSREEILDGFMLHVKDDNDLDMEIERIYENAERRGFSVQPFPLIVGKKLTAITASYVVLERILILMDSPMQAFEVAFKFYFALHAEYPVSSKRQWTVIQKSLFNLHVPWDRVSPIANNPEVKRLIRVLQCAS